MALTDCPECGEEVSDTADSCPHCGYDLSEDEMDDGMKTCLGCLGVVVVIGLMVWFLASIVYRGGGQLMNGGRGAENGNDGQLGSASMAWVMCQDFVEDRLRAPGTASYPWGYPDYTEYEGDGRYRVEAYVDAENAFGGEIRNEFTCVVETDGSEKWELLRLDMKE